MSAPPTLCAVDVYKRQDIGQTITAIRTQAGIVQRLAADNASVKQSGQLIEQLSLGVYDAVRRLLGRLRPRQLDDLTPVSYTHLVDPAGGSATACRVAPVGGGFAA